jgi:TolB-like protein/Flp pilus assembly protein TadD
MSFFQELKRRNVVRVAIAYLITAWLLLQLVDLVLEHVVAPDWVMHVFMLLLGVGFPVALIFAWAFEMTPEGIKKEKDVDRAQSITSQTGRKLDFAIIGVLVVAVGFLLFDRIVSQPSEPAVATDVAVEQETAGDAAKSIAVLPFINMSSDPEQEYFSDGISEEILNALARIKELKVAGRTSSFAFKGEQQDLRQIGDTLGVEHILEGSVRKFGNTVRITAQLIQVDDGFHLWSDTYDRELDNVFEIQDEIATAILLQLKATLLDGEVPVVATPRANSQAYDLYLLAKQRMYERSRPTLEDAAAKLDQAIAIDSGYAPAYAQRGITALLLADDQYGTLPRDQSQTQSKLYLDQALRLDPQQPEALAGLGLYYSNEPGHTQEAIDALEQALAINPNMIDASNWLQIAYGNAGRLTETLKILEDMAQRDPLYRPGIANLNRAYRFRNELDKATAMVEKIRPFMPNDPFLLRIEANIELARGNAAKGLVLIEQALELQPDNGPNIGMRGQALMVTAQYERLAEVGMPWQKIIALEQLGRTEEATLMAWKLAESGEDVETLIGLLANSGRADEMVRFFEERWDSLEAFDNDYPILGRGGVGTMLDIAYAYGNVGNQQRFDEAMNRSRKALDELNALGFKNPFMELIEAVYFAMAGDRDAAVGLLSSAVDGGLLVGTRFARAWSGLSVLEGDPEYEAVQSRMVDHLNAERAELGLEPVTT